MGDESSKDHFSQAAEPVDDLFKIEVPMVPAKLIRVEELSNVLPALKEANCQPGSRTLITSVVKAARGEVEYAQVMILDPAVPPRITCSVDNLFPNAPVEAKLTLTKRFSEFIFKPNQTVSEWLDAGRLDLQVKLLDIMTFFSF